MSSDSGECLGTVPSLTCDSHAQVNGSEQKTEQKRKLCAQSVGPDRKGLVYVELASGCRLLISVTAMWANTHLQLCLHTGSNVMTASSLFVLLLLSYFLFL